MGHLSMVKVLFPLLLNIIFTTLIRKTRSTYPQFQDCKPCNCGKGPNISYPFYLPHQQKSYCGYPNFEISCKGEEPIFNMSGGDYLIKEIFYKNHSLLVTNYGLVQNDCPVPLHNITLERTPFKFFPDQIDLFFFYNCTGSVPANYVTYTVPCASYDASHHSFRMLVYNGLLEFSNNFTCKSLVSTPVNVEGEVGSEISGEKGYLEFLKKGFLLEWTVNNCSECEGSGGRCGFLKKELVCFCPDGPHPISCNGGALCKEHWHFDGCNPGNCGNGLNISYPFWIQDKQDSFCGVPGFQLSCKNDSPILKMSPNSYIIRNISYKDQSLRVVDAGALDDTCPPRIRNVTLDRTPFSYGPSQAKLFLFFNCSTSLVHEYKPYCTPNNNTHPTLAVFNNETLLNYMSTEGNCETSIAAPVDKNGTQGESNLELLKEGFVLTWNATNCSFCQDSGGSCGYNWTTHNFVCFCPDRPHLRRCQNRKKELNVKVKLIVGFCALAVGILLACLFIYRRRLFGLIKRRNLSPPNSKSNSSSMDFEKGGIWYGVPIFSYDELEEATNNFDSNKELGDGGFGTVYRGKLRDGRVVAVKRLYDNNFKRVEQFMNEVVILTRLRHQNLVTLYGCTSRHCRELLLVYEYVPNGTVADHLHGDRAEAGSLTWPIRMSIAVETASALSYLHASDIIHRDVKTTNILLDNAFHVKVADFGLSRLFPTDVTHISTSPQGTPGYVDPEYHQCYQLTDKSDVYSFGVVLIELISSKPAVDITRHRHEINLANLAINKIQNRTLHELVDPSLGFESDIEVRRMITMVAELAFRCLQPEKELRPSMDEAWEILRGIESEDYKVEKAEIVDILGDHVGLLKNIPPPFSPDSVTLKWVSQSTTPGVSG